ncbi:MAG: glycoside hydrolase family 43 protein [Defluviitaleaceae bacterium]|nr:glycoside hydrolase family 43 protein [Defluviitaleaceae bacterium]
MHIFKNPVLPGFYPDPSVCRVGNDFYLVTSTFAYFPGVPIFHSRDLVNWTQIGNVLTRPSQLRLENAEVSQGIFAPTIRYDNGVFYMITTNVSGGGNFFVTATDPAGPWSEPFFIEGAQGIDPSLYFEDGRCFYHGTRERENGAYYGDNEIYLQELDLATKKLVGERHIIWHCALKDAVWPEGPHIYKKDGWYYLLISEGGTGHHHAITVARSRTLTGYYEGNKCNPILTHRHLGHNYPIANVGHGDLVETPAGEWWMVLLASRPYGGYFRNLGRETFLVPVTWEDEWPVVNCGVGLVRLEEVAPKILGEKSQKIALPLQNNLSEKPTHMMFLRNPVEDDYSFTPDGLFVRLNKHAITDLGSVSFFCVRQQHMSFETSVRLTFAPANENECAGLVLFQNRKYHYQFVLTRSGEGANGAANVLRVIKCENEELQILAETPVDFDCVVLQISARGQELEFSYSGAANRKNVVPATETAPENSARTTKKIVLANACAKILNSDTAGGFVGNTIGMYASSNGAESENCARFTEFFYSESS